MDDRRSLNIAETTMLRKRKVGGKLKYRDRNYKEIEKARRERDNTEGRDSDKKERRIVKAKRRIVRQSEKEEKKSERGKIPESERLKVKKN